MGITIHYRGRLDDVGRLDRLCEELTDIAASMGWESTRLDDDWQEPVDARLRFTDSATHIDGNLGLKGVLIAPGGGSESLSFFFDRDGYVRSPMEVVLIVDGTLKPEDAWVSVKTQFAPIGVHVWIVGLLKYLKRRYVSDLEVSDEGEYWETGDIQILKKKMDFLGRKIDELAGDLTAGRLGDMSDLSAEEIASRIERYYSEKWGADPSE